LKNTAYKNNVLIIDGHALTRFGLRTALEARKIFKNILEAESGEKGLELSKEFKPDVVIMDICLPGIGGIETIKNIKILNKNAKIVILTFDIRQEQVLDAVYAGTHAYCTKDIDSERLLNIIETVSDGAIWFDSSVSGNILNLLVKKQKNKSEQKKIRLTNREIEVLKLIVNGCNNAEISENLCVSIHTAKAHVCNILRKLSVEDRTQAAIMALKHNII